jgi:hypothetical protein
MTIALWNSGWSEILSPTTRELINIAATIDIACEINRVKPADYMYTPDYEFVAYNRRIHKGAGKGQYRTVVTRRKLDAATMLSRNIVKELLWAERYGMSSTRLAELYS